MSVKDLINAISAGNTADSQDIFQSVMAEKISTKLESAKMELARNMFRSDSDINESVELDEGKVKEFEMDLKELSDKEFEKKYGSPKSEFKETNEEVEVEEELDEEFEQLDELSKSTLGSYIHKASNSKGDAAYALGRKRADADDVDRFTNRHMKNKYDIRDKLKKDIGASGEDQEKDLEVMWKRSKGIGRAVSKLTKEQVEDFFQTEEFDQLDELSKKTLRNYVYKASDDARDKSKRADWNKDMYVSRSRHPGLNSPKDQQRYVDGEKENAEAARKRYTGIGKAVSKLTSK